MNRKNNPRSLRNLVFRKVCEMLREAAVKWTPRLKLAAVMSRDTCLQEIESVEEECALVRQRFASHLVPSPSDHIIRNAVKTFARTIASYDNGIDRTFINTLHDAQIHHDICMLMLKAVLLPCMSTCNVRTTESMFVQEIIIRLLYVIPNVRSLILPPEQGLTYLEHFVERIQVLTHLQEFHFHVGCTREVIVELSEYCHSLKNCPSKTPKVWMTCVSNT
jgi:hypothetical protein